MALGSAAEATAEPTPRLERLAVKSVAKSRRVMQMTLWSTVSEQALRPAERRISEAGVHAAVRCPETMRITRLATSAGGPGNGRRLEACATQMLGAGVRWSKANLNGLVYSRARGAVA